MIKTFTKRDSATAFLRKLGYPKNQYNDLIIKEVHGSETKFVISVHEPSEESKRQSEFGDLVQSQLVRDPAADPVYPKKQDPKPGKKGSNQDAKGMKKDVGKNPGPKAKSEASKQLDAKKAELKKLVTAKVTVSSRARELIRKGHINGDVFQILQKEFGLDDSKKGYPAWYRSKMRQAGEKV